MSNQKLRPIDSPALLRLLCDTLGIDGPVRRLFISVDANGPAYCAVTREIPSVAEVTESHDILAKGVRVG